MEVSKLSDMEFRVMVIKINKEFNGNFLELRGYYEEFSESYVSMEIDIYIMNKNQAEPKQVWLNG